MNSRTLENIEKEIEIQTSYIDSQLEDLDKLLEEKDSIIRELSLDSYLEFKKNKVTYE